MRGGVGQFPPPGWLLPALTPDFTRRLVGLWLPSLPPAFTFDLICIGFTSPHALVAHSDAACGAVPHQRGGGLDSGSP